MHIPDWNEMNKIVSYHKQNIQHTVIEMTMCETSTHSLINVLCSGTKGKKCDGWSHISNPSIDYRLSILAYAIKKQHQNSPLPIYQIKTRTNAIISSNRINNYSSQNLIIMTKINNVGAKNT